MNYVDAIELRNSLQIIFSSIMQQFVVNVYVLFVWPVNFLLYFLTFTNCKGS